MMGLFSGLAKAVVSVATLPVDVVVDLTTLGGEMLGQQEPNTKRRLREIGAAMDATHEREPRR